MSIIVPPTDLYFTKQYGFYYAFHFDRGLLVPLNKGLPFMSQHALVEYATTNKYVRVFQCSHTTLLTQSPKSTIDTKAKHA